MKKPLKKDYCKPFIFDPEKYVTFDSKAYAKDAAKYIEHIEGLNTRLAELLETILKTGYHNTEAGEEAFKLLSELNIIKNIK